LITTPKTGKRIYKIVTASTAKALEEKVMALLEERWKLSGGAQLAMTGSAGEFNHMIKEYLQAMTKTF
jgi:hypothetical protein